MTETRADGGTQHTPRVSVIPERTPEQAAGEAAFMEVHETIVNIEAALNRAERAMKALARKENPHAYLLEAMERAIKELDDARRHLMQRTYWAMEDRGTYEVEPANEAASSDYAGEQPALFETDPDAPRMF